MENNNPDARAGAYSPDDDPGACRVPFGKHAGKSLRQLLTEAPGYFRWLRKNAYSPRLKEAIGKFAESQEARNVMKRAQARKRWGRSSASTVDDWAMR